MRPSKTIPPFPNLKDISLTDVFFILVDFYLVDYFTIFLRYKMSFIFYEILLLQGL